MRIRNLNLVVLFTACLQAQNAPKAVVPEADFHFPKTVAGDVIEHDFILRNTGDAPLRLQKTDMTPPLRPTKLPSVVLPGAEAVLHFRLDTSKLNSTRDVYEGQIVLYTDDPKQPEIGLTFQGEVIPPIEFDPLPAFFVATQQGESKTASIEIINHQPGPLDITEVKHTSTRFTTKLETLEPGQRYRLSLTLSGNGIAGKQTELIQLLTTSRRNPNLQVSANTLIKERVYTFPADVDLGVIRTSQLKADLQSKAALTQPLMVYQAGGNDFQITLQSDVPFLELSMARAETKDRYQIEINIIPEKLKPGTVEGSIVITTNDPEFPRLTIPVKAVVEGSW